MTSPHRKLAHCIVLPLAILCGTAIHAAPSILDTCASDALMPGAACPVLLAQNEPATPGQSRAAAPVDRFLVIINEEYGDGNNLPGLVEHNFDGVWSLALDGLKFGFPEYEYYRNGIDPTKFKKAGALQAETETALSRAKAVMASNTVTNVSGAGLWTALDTLEKSTQPGDRVFVYYGGHGAAFQHNSRCEAGLVGTDGVAVAATDVDDILRKIHAKARVLVAVVDSCFSGGLVDAMSFRGKDSKASKAVNKSMFVSLDDCGKAVNEVGASLSQTSRGGPSDQHYASLLTTAADNEVGWSNSELGSLGTYNVQKCINDSREPGPARQMIFKDAGWVSLDGIEKCAQSTFEDEVEMMAITLQHYNLFGSTRIPLN